MKKITDYIFFKKLCDLAFIEKIYLYGSRARGDNDERSDIDLAIFCPQATDRQWQAVLNIIDDADTLLKIDCIRYDKIHDENLKTDIIKNHKVLYCK